MKSIISRLTSKMERENHLALEQVLQEVYDERQRQHEKWGEQNHRNGTGQWVLRDMSYRCTTADAAKGLCERMFKEGRGSYAHILYEEVSEAFEESDAKKLRAELVQVAAVAVAWVEKIDRDSKRAKDEGVAR